MDRDLAELIFKHISIFKYHYPDTKVKVEILDDDIFVLHNDLFLSDDQSYQLLIYSFSREYLKRDYSVFWASEVLTAYENPTKSKEIGQNHLIFNPKCSIFKE